MKKYHAAGEFFSAASREDVLNFSNLVVGLGPMNLGSTFAILHQCTAFLPEMSKSEGSWGALVKSKRKVVSSAIGDVEEITEQRPEAEGAESDLVIPLRRNMKVESLEETSTMRPLLVGSLSSEVLGRMDDNQRFKHDISSRAEDLTASSAAYRAVPVEQFGAALLRGMGWKPPVTQNAVPDDKPLVARERGLGLGATAKPPVNGRGRGDPAEWAQMAAARISAGKIEIGVLVWLRDVRYSGRRACVSQVAAESIQVHVILESTGATVQVQRTDIVVLTARELEENPYRGVVVAAAAVDGLKKRRQGEVQGQGLDSSQEAQDDGLAKRARVVTAGETDAPSKERVDWLRAGIRVRIVSKHVGGAAAYLQKGAVVEVYGPDKGLASVRLADGSLLENVKQRHLETVLPAVGMPCLVLSGAYAGQRVRLLEKRKSEERVVVEMDDGLEVVVSMNDVAAEIES